MFDYTQIGPKASSMTAHACRATLHYSAMVEHLQTVLSRRSSGKRRVA